MFAIHCHHCQQRFLVDMSVVESFRNTEHGPEATVTCPRGHLVSHDFRTGASTPVQALAA